MNPVSNTPYETSTTKRRSTSSSSRNAEEQNDSDSRSSLDVSRKRKKTDTSEDLLQTLYDSLRYTTKEDGSGLCDLFLRAPKRRLDPAYYEKVHHPIDFSIIHKKLKSSGYEDIDDFQMDIDLLVSNTKAYYKKTSQEYKDAAELWDTFLYHKARLYESKDNGEDKGKIILKVGKLAKRANLLEAKKEMPDLEESSTDSWVTNVEDDNAIYEDLFTTVMTATDNDGRPLHPVFQLLPSKKRYPKYYEVIDSPIDLRMIARKIQEGKYSSLGEMEKDLLLMAKNACIFNEPGSQIYKDAKAIKRLVTTKKGTDVESTKATPGKMSERIRNKRLRGSAPSWSSVTAGLISDEEQSESEGEAEDSIEDEGEDNILWQLYNSVFGYRDSQGVRLSNLFWRLPSRRFNPNFFKEVKSPLSIFMIRRKLTGGLYETVDDVVADFNTMFDDYLKNFKSDTKQYKNAEELKNVMRDKLEELRPPKLETTIMTEEESGDEGDDDSYSHVKRFKCSKLLSRGKYLDNIPLKHRLFAIFKCLVECQAPDGRQPIEMFMEKPSKKMYPDYYEIIRKPIDMITIENNIRNEVYTCEEEILEDLKLMFDNCKQYNEEGSQVYDDAVCLQKALDKRMKELGPIEKVDKKPIIKKEKADMIAFPTTPVPSTVPKMKKMSSMSLPPVHIQKMKSLYNTIKEYRDLKGRQLSVIFNKLPPKHEYPDYYELIEKPMYLELIAQKLKNGAYENLEEISSDFILMCDNACKYNEPDSQIYKDALVLHRVTLQTKILLNEDDGAIPDVKIAVRELLTSLFASTYNHQDEEGRCFSDSLAELPEHEEIDGKKFRALSLDLIKRRLDVGQYRRLDVFQDDMFACFDRARRLTRTDSQVFEDSVELQSFFIKQRDELCANGSTLSSSALKYTVDDLINEVEALKKVKAESEASESEDADPESMIEDEAKQRMDEDTLNAVASIQDDIMAEGDVVPPFRAGDFVYIESTEARAEMPIIGIQRIFRDQQDVEMLYGVRYYRPNETFHVTTRKFLQNEVFKTEVTVALPTSNIKGKCAVISVKDYFKYRPVGFEDSDVYVCESRYSAKARNFKKIKVWTTTMTSKCQLVERETPLEPNRDVSVFRNRIEKHKEEIAELEEREKVVEKTYPNVIAMERPKDGLDDYTYYDQFNTSTFLIKTGDCVYVKNVTKARSVIVLIDKIWTTKTGNAFINGQWANLPSDPIVSNVRKIYKREIALSIYSCTHATESITGKCSVLDYEKYVLRRITEINEEDVYLFRSMYDEIKRQLIENVPSDILKKYNHNSLVRCDEIYYFRKPILPAKLLLYTTGIDNEAFVNKNVDGYAQPMSSSPMLARSLVSQAITPIGRKNKSSNFYTPNTPTTKSKLVTGYILYSSDVRRNISQINPSCSFADISRIVGNDWKNLPPSEKLEWEEKAQRINEEAKLEKFVESGGCNSPANAGAGAGSFIGPQLANHVWECYWDGCDYMFEDQTDCIEHTINEITGHVATYFAEIQPPNAEYQCRWKGCQRLKKNAPPFPNLTRLIRHVREVHICKAVGRVVMPYDRSCNYVPSRFQKHRGENNQPISNGIMMTPTPPPPPQPSSSSTQLMTPLLSTFGVLKCDAQSQTDFPMFSNDNEEKAPIFVTVPPSSNRVKHSEIYLKYIEGLNKRGTTFDRSQTWRKQLQTNVPYKRRYDGAVAGSGSSWYFKNDTAQDEVVDALNCMREYMLRDAFKLSKLS